MCCAAPCLLCCAVLCCAAMCCAVLRCSVDRTVGFLTTIEAELAAFHGSRFHILGNHDVDILYGRT